MNTLSSLLNWIGNTIGANPSTLTTSSKTLVGAINEVGADYIVEQGTSGIWTYRKWNSGIAECWAQQDITITAWSSWGSLYYCTPYASETYPSGLFLYPPCLSATKIGGVDAELASTTDGSAILLPSFYLVRPTSAPTGSTWYMSYYAIGKWK